MSDMDDIARAASDKVNEILAKAANDAANEVLLKSVTEATNQMICRKGGVVVKEDKLKNVTEKEFDVMAILKILEDKLWTTGNIMKINGKEVVMKGDTYGQSIEEVVAHMKGYFETAQTDDTWKDGKHCGDCTKVPMTCFRCMCENYLSTARKFIDYFNNGEYQNY